MNRVRQGAFINCDDVIVGQGSGESHLRRRSHPLSFRSCTAMHAHTPQEMQRKRGGLQALKCVVARQRGSKCVKGVCAGDCCPCAKAGLMLHTKACVWVRGSWLLNVLYSRGRRGAFRRGGARFPIQSPFVIESSHLHEPSSRENVLGMCTYNTCTHVHARTPLFCLRSRPRVD